MASEGNLTTGLRKVASLAGRYLSSGKPHHAQWLVTRKCNYRCVGCNVWKEQDEHELSTAEIKKGLTILKDSGIVELTISGGDPLLRPDIAEILDYASEHFITTVYDNGSMAAKKIDTLRKVDFVAISIDSLDETKNDAIKGIPGAWKNAMHAVDALQKEGIRVAVTPTISQKNLYEIMDLTTYFIGRGIPMWFCLYSYDTSVDTRQLFRIGKANDEFIITDKEAMVNLCDQLIETMKKNKNILMTKKLLQALRGLYETKEQRTWKCQALNQFLVVDHLGRVSGCHNHNFTCSIFDLPTQWKNKKFKTLQETYHNCTQCNYLCYIAYSLYGSPKSIISLACDQWKNIKILFK
ncbi:MAG: radical SAM protein [Nitrososphaerota archaeon]|nr:radical SAM protein [Nitrososphaerota archaeon]